MVSKHEDALVCDLAETYGLYDYRQHAPLYVATLMIGLRAESRLKTELSGLKIPMDMWMQAAIVDRLGLLFWAQTEDGAKNRNRPPSILEALTDPKKRESDIKTFASPEEFKAAWAKATGEGHA